MKRIRLLPGIICIALFGWIAAETASTPVAFQGRFLGVVCGDTEAGKWEVLDTIRENAYNLDLTLIDFANPRQLSTDKFWNGPSQNGATFTLRQAGPSKVQADLKNGVITLNAIWEVSFEGKKAQLPFVLSTETASFPQGIPGNIRPRRLQTDPSGKRATLAIAGFTPLEGALLEQFREALRSRRKSEPPEHLLLAGVVDGTASLK